MENCHGRRPRLQDPAQKLILSSMRIKRPCLIIRDFGTHTTPRALQFSALVIDIDEAQLFLHLHIQAEYVNKHIIIVASIKPSI